MNNDLHPMERPFGLFCMYQLVSISDLHMFRFQGGKFIYFVNAHCWEGPAIIPKLRRYLWCWSILDVPISL